MNIKSNYFNMTKDEFDTYLDNLKMSENCILLLNGNFFYIQTLEESNMIITLTKKMFELDNLINSFTDFTKNQIIQSFLLDEIISTNKIENINSTKHDIFSIISKSSLSIDKKVVSISNAYKQLLNSYGTNIDSLESIRNLYDVILKNSIKKNDLADGIYFRKEPVFIMNGIKSIHEGINGENNINNFMKEFVFLYNSKNEIFTKMILCHFLFEYIHPYYDGNGRLGRYLFSNGLFLETKSYFSFVISYSFEQEKAKYYKAFKEANDKYSFGCLNQYFTTICSILINQIEKIILNLKEKKLNLEKYEISFNMTKKEEKIYKLILESSIFSYFGIKNEEIIKETNVSKRTLIYALNKFKDMGILKDTKIGKYDFHKINI